MPSWQVSRGGRAPWEISLSSRRTVLADAGHYPPAGIVAVVAAKAGLMACPYSIELASHFQCWRGLLRFAKRRSR